VERESERERERETQKTRDRMSETKEVGPSGKGVPPRGESPNTRIRRKTIARKKKGGEGGGGTPPIHRERVAPFDPGSGLCQPGVARDGTGDDRGHDAEA
jgi:hypothetical protein